jgi:AraC-like DNA-binding protein
LQSDLAVSFDQTRKVLANGSRMLGAGWYLSLANALTISSHGPLGFATVTAPDLRTSVDVLLRFIGIRVPFAWLAGTVEDDHFVIRLFETIEMGEERTALIELVMLALQGLLERPLGREIREANITFANPAPVYRQQLETTFHPELTFNASGHTLSFPVTWLDEHCALFDEAMHRYLVARCVEELETASGVIPAEIAVRQALLARPRKPPGLAEIASMQHVSPRTLIRRLKRGHTSYHEILESVRKTLATDYLLNADMSVASIAYRLGYQDPSNFGRAFRRWFKTSPGHYRRQSKR